MEAFESRRNPAAALLLPAKPAFSVSGSSSSPNLWGGSISDDAHRVLVVMDVGKELSYTALDWTLDHVLQSGDALKLLGVLQQVSTSNKAGFQAGLSKLGYKSWTDEKGLNGANRSVLDAELLTKKHILQSNLDLHLRCQKLGITLDIDVQLARDLKSLIVEVARNLGTHHVVLDRSMKKDKKYYIDNLTCYVTRVKTNDTCQALRPGLPPDMITISRPISPVSSPQIPATLDRRPSHRRSTASMFLKGEPDLHSIQSEAEVLDSEVESEQGITTCINPNNMRQELIAVRQWLEDQGSPEPEIYPREESLQLSASPRSDVISPAATDVDSCTDARAFPRKAANENNGMGAAAGQQQQMSETVTNSCMSPTSDDSPTVASSSSVTQEPPMQALVSRPSAADAWPSMVDDAEAVNPRHDTSSRAQQGPISVQPRRVDASWMLQNLNDLLNGDVGSYLSAPETVSTKLAAVVKPMPVTTKLSTSKSTPAHLDSLRGRSPVPHHRQQHHHQQHHHQQHHHQQHHHQQHHHQQHHQQQQHQQQQQQHHQQQHQQQEQQEQHQERQEQRQEERQRQAVVMVAGERAAALQGQVQGRRGALFTKKQGPVAPPLCTVCKHKTPEFGKAARRFGYGELRYATDNFNHHNYLAQGGYGSVYRGILPEGQLIAVKQHKIASNQGDEEFCAEVEVLSCAQHRNLVTLIGYCVENEKRLLVYEYVCNGSLDRHLSAKNRECLPWKYRQKIALGSARALRYLHEECRVGCIVHRDMRPNNILLTHDFTPMVGDFGLARRQMHGDMAEETRVLGTLGYLAPEYAETGQITEKADVYAFGVVLLEIITGRKAVLMSQQGGKNGVLLTDWARELLDRPNVELVDPRLLGTECSDNNLFEMHCMMHAARQCIKKDPAMRPRMAQVLRILDPQQDGEALYGRGGGGGMGTRKMTPEQLPAFPPLAAAAAAQADAAAAGDSGKLKTAASLPVALDDSSSYFTTSTSSSPVSKPSKHKGMKGKSKSMFKTSRSSSAPRLSYDEQRNLEDEEDGFREGVLLSYNSMLEFV